MEIKENIPLAPYTTLKVGGPAKFFCEAQNEDEIVEAMKFAREKNLPVFVLGGGSNILVSDKGFDGLVVKILTTNFLLLATSIECGSGCNLGTVVNESAKAGLTGLEWAAGIPGTVGGAIRGNAGAFGGEMEDAVESVSVLNVSQSEFKISNFKTENCEFGYRSSVFKQDQNLIILSVKLKLKKGNRAESEQKIKEILKQRNALQPTDFPSSGSFFKNPCLAGRQAVVENKKLIEEYEKDTGNKIEGGIIPAGYLIDALGLRGKKIGGAMVSEKHGNFLVNAGNAKAEDFIILAAVIKTRVRNKFSIQLKEEVQMVGF